jgi:hypothetical protein
MRLKINQRRLRGYRAVSTMSHSTHGLLIFTIADDSVTSSTDFPATTVPAIGGVARGEVSSYHAGSRKLRHGVSTRGIMRSGATVQGGRTRAMDTGAKLEGTKKPSTVKAPTSTEDMTGRWYHSMTECYRLRRSVERVLEPTGQKMKRWTKLS